MSDFLGLPSELRNNIYKRLLVRDEPVNPRTRMNLHMRRHNLTPDLLLVNKTIYREASSLLYAQNCFDLRGCGPNSQAEHAGLFFAKIGSTNTQHIRHVWIDFPHFQSLDADTITLTHAADCMLASIQSNCINLRTLTAIIHYNIAHCMDFELIESDRPNIVPKALALADARFRGIASLREVFVKVYKKGPSRRLESELKGFGWKVNGRVWEEDGSSSEEPSDNGEGDEDSSSDEEEDSGEDDEDGFESDDDADDGGDGADLIGTDGLIYGHPLNDSTL
ncbi:hypothetical protein BU16DRAFT_75700 [Lophium mytilinum]|uniref:F-box domain-containing protein n=1 Tax=Lophium mytilinum TaxID=390894 RepID=A0A6A6QLQ5_9PEZI|nr:hypothetical protein BU16DRAFT_75700 [Lophium mytilinum]